MNELVHCRIIGDKRNDFHGPATCGQMRIISFIEEPKIIDRIIAHLKLTFEAERPPPPHIAHQKLLMAAEEREEYF